jgi:hypothetical protein
MVIAPLLATLFVVLRWSIAAQNRLGNFVILGSRYVTRTAATRGLRIGSGNGYDGQFYFRLALDPFDLSRRAFGIRLDSLSRVERMGYPFLAWVVSGGHHGAVPLAMVIVNVLMTAVVALAGGVLAKAVGRHAFWGLAFAGYWGYLWTLGRDLTELTAAAFVMLGLAALVRRAPWWSGLAFLGAIVSKETSVLLIGTLALSTMYLRWKGRPTLLTPATESSGAPTGLAGVRLRASDIAYVLPLAAFVAWEAVLLAGTGRLPIFKSGGENLGLPLVGAYRGFVHYVGQLPHYDALLWIGELGVLILLALGAALVLRHAPFEFRCLWAVSVVLAACTATGIWLGDVGFRSLDDTYLMSWVVLLFLPRAAPAPAPAAAPSPAPAATAPLGGLMVALKLDLLPWKVLCIGSWIVVFIELVKFI